MWGKKTEQYTGEMKIEGHIFWGEPNSPYNFVSPDEDTGALSEMMPTRPPASQVGPLCGRVGKKRKRIVSSPLVWYKPNERASAFFFSITFPILYIDFFTI